MREKVKSEPCDAQHLRCLQCLRKSDKERGGLFDCGLCKVHLWAYDLSVV